jgi:hypothetical protein
MRTTIERLESFLALFSGISLSLFTGGDIYIWLSKTPAPLAGIYSYFSSAIFWDFFHTCTVVAFALSLILIGITARKLYMPSLAFN